MTSELSTLITTYPPPFIYVHDPQSFKSTCNIINSIFREETTPPSSPSSLFSSSSSATNPFIIHHARIDATSTFTNRLLFEAVINSLAGWEVNWEDGCSNWHEEVESRWNENLDSFIHGLRAVHAYLCRQQGISNPTQEKGKRANATYENVRLVIVIERAERLKETVPELVVPLTRLAEMVSHNVSHIFILMEELLGAIGYDHYIYFSSRLGGYQTFIRCFSRSLLYRYTTTIQRK